MTLPLYRGYTENSVLTYNTTTDKPQASQNESINIPKWLQILESDPTKLAMFTATQLRWIPSFIEAPICSPGSNLQ